MIDMNAIIEQLIIGKVFVFKMGSSDDGPQEPEAINAIQNLYSGIDAPSDDQVLRHAKKLASVGQLNPVLDLFGAKGDPLAIDPEVKKMAPNAVLMRGYTVVARHGTEGFDSTYRIYLCLYRSESDVEP